jgi:hypothetical protein
VNRAFQMFRPQIDVHARHHAAMFDPDVAMVVDHDFRDVRCVQEFFQRRERLEEHIDSSRFERLQLQYGVIVKVGHAMP